MESGSTEEFPPAVAESKNVVITNSAENFQSFIYELFEKNGILNDLRAYLRGHIVNVLKSAQTGDPPACQKHFTQRLELTYQALNILIAEYLLRLEFSYSFSVFISEIPLANMVFGFAKSLMESNQDNMTDIRFKDCDVWSILNYLGVQCDSEHASNIVEMYRNDKQNPLLLCILKCMPMYRDFGGIEPSNQAVSSEESLSSLKSIDSIEIKNIHCRNTSLPDKCKHYIYCKTCQTKMCKVKEKYKKKKKYFSKNLKECSSLQPCNMESLVKNINTTEKRLMEEMFQQLKSVYETEVEMLKVEEENKVKRSMASHALQLQKKRDEMEESFKAREAELERNVQQKKRFLWGLARALRHQHEHMARAMRDVRAETRRLSTKEDSLKSQLAEAEEILKKRGEEMRAQISNELTILEGHLESMKRERDNITRERSELEQLKTLQDSNSKVIKVHNMDSDDVHSHYNLLKNELAILKKYLESSKLAPKCVIERSTGTDPCESTSNYNVALNNSQGAERGSKSDDCDDRVKSNLLVNDFKKKNVNFSHSNLDEIYHETSRGHSRSSVSSEAGDNATQDLELDRERDQDRELIQRLREENERLKAFARRQRSHIERLSGRGRPHTAPAAVNAHNLYNVNTSVSANTVSVGWRKGAGEELSVFSNAQPRILVPGDTLPFIGVLRDRHGNARRPLLGQGRGTRGRAWPLAGISKRSTSPLRERLTIGAGSSGMGIGTRFPIASCSIKPDDETVYQSIRDRLQQHPRPALSLEINRERNREKSPKSLLREAKEKLRNKDSIKDSPPTSRDKSPNSVLREAKMRLRKLEIEAEAVEKSYMDFRRRQSELRLERSTRGARLHEEPTKETSRNLDVQQSQSLEKMEETKNEIQAQFADIQKAVRNDFDKYLREYKAKFEVGVTHFRVKPTVTEKVKPIPEAYSSIKDNVCDSNRDNYLEKPMTEFRKLYTSARQTERDESETKSLTRSIHSDHTSIISVRNEFDYEPNARHDARLNAQHAKQAELEILKQNIHKMYNLPNANIDTNVIADQNNCQTHETRQNLLRVEVESISEINDINSQTQQLLLVVESSANTREVNLTQSNCPNEVVSAQMTIIVSPKRSGAKSIDDDAVSHKSERPKRSLSPEQAAHLTRNDVLDAIFHADPNNHISSVQMQLELSKDGLEDSISEYEKGEYADDFSADVDNYNSRSDYENTPISQPKTSEDDNFWDS